MLFLAYVPVPAVEAEAIVTYANNYLPYFIQPGGKGVLTVTGFVVCALLSGVIALLNLLAQLPQFRVSSFFFERFLHPWQRAGGRMACIF